jgi:hypothetical protein
VASHDRFPEWRNGGENKRGFAAGLTQRAGRGIKSAAGDTELPVEMRQEKAGGVIE